MNRQNTNRLFPFIKKNRYFNNCNDYPESFLFQTLPSFLASLRNRKKRQPEDKSLWIAQDMPLDQSIEPIITWIGHATFLIQIGGVNILTDPIFGDASLFFPRILPPGISLDRLARIDIVLLSHNHRDHCDMASLVALKKNNPDLMLLVPQGDKKWLEKKGFGSVKEHIWWDSCNFESPTGISVNFTFLPAHHWSAQGIFDWNKSLWGSWMIRTKDHKPIYFAGDTAYSNHFKNIASQFPTIHTALMPIAPEEPHPSMRKSHMDAHQAIQAFIDLQADHFVPMHWGTFPFGLDTFHGPLERLNAAWQHHQLQNNKKLTIAKVGQRLHLFE